MHISGTQLAQVSWVPACTGMTLALAFALLALPFSSAHAHTGLEHAVSFASGFKHPFTGLDHMLAMVAVGLWAGLNGGRALWVWPVAFVGVMVLGGALGISGICGADGRGGHPRVRGCARPAGAGGGATAGGRRCDSGRGLRSAARPRARRRASRRCRGQSPTPQVSPSPPPSCTPSASAFPGWLPTPTADLPCAARVRWWRPPASLWRSRRRPA